MKNLQTLDDTAKNYKLRWQNFSGDWFEGTYTEREATALFENKCVTSQQVEVVPPTGQWFYVWNRACGRTFECWKQ